MKNMTRRIAALALALVMALAFAALAEEAGDAASAAEAEASLIEEVSAGEEVAVEAAEPSAVEAANAVSGRIDFTEDMAPYAGRWVTFEDGFKLFLPQEWARFDMSAEQQQAGLFYQAGNDGADSIVGEVAMGVAVSFIHAEDLTTLDDLAADFAGVGFSEIDKLDVNGFPCITFAKAADNYRGLAFYHPTHPSYVMAVYISPAGADDQTVNDVGSAVLCSLSPFGK